LEKNIELQRKIEDLDNLLLSVLDRDSKLDFEKLYVKAALPKLNVQDLMTVHSAAPIGSLRRILFFIGSWNWLRNYFENKNVKIESVIGKAINEFKKEDEDRLQKLKSRELNHQKEVSRLTKAAKDRNEEIFQWKIAFTINGESKAISRYFSEVLLESPYPVGFPKNSSVIYISESKLLLVDYQLPTLDGVVPTQKLFKYIKSDDSVSETSSPASARKNLYTDVIAKAVIRSINEIFRADFKGYVETIVLNGHVKTISPETGKSL
jgi:restriction system protein